jgi:predicted nucleic acid-binding protein
MPTKGSAPDLLVDTSVAVALVVADHEHHERTVKAVAGRRLGLAGHAAFETFSVLTRLPMPLRRTPSAAAALLARNFAPPRLLSSAAAQRLLGRLPALRIAGGAVYDALVGAAAVEQALELATRDRRAINTYRLLDVDLEILL